MADQRRRILVALSEAMAEKGYVATTVADVLERAGVSRETFYQQFSSKQDAFMAAFEGAGVLAVDSLRDDPVRDGADRAGRAGVDVPADAGIRTSQGRSADPVERFAVGLRLYLASLVDNPALARTFLVEVHAAGPEAIARRAVFQQRVVDAMVSDLGLGERNRFACELVVAATAALVTPLLVAGDLESIVALEAPIVAALARLLEA